MIGETKRILMVLALMFISGYVIIGVIFYNYTYNYALDQNKKKLDRILLNQRALANYIEGELKPVIYKLKKENQLYEDFFDPKVLSSSYISRRIYENANSAEEREMYKMHYKLAADNPRNIVNKANEDETKILNYFRKNPQIKEYSKTLVENGMNYIYYAMPFEPNKESCMTCHSTPEKAPIEMLELYGKTAGFGEEKDMIRAMVSLKMPFDNELSEANKNFILIMSLWTFFLIALYSIIAYFILKLNKSKHIIEEKNKALASLSELDSLTSIYNRRRFDRDLTKYISDKSLGLIIIDIDHFKEINDKFGHQMGDEVLQKLSQLLKSLLRECDFLYRIGGEEFAILMHRSSTEEVKNIVKRLLTSVSEYDFNVGHNVNISAGIAMHDDFDTPSLMYKHADIALYKAKESGRNRFVVYEPTD